MILNLGWGLGILSTIKCPHSRTHFLLWFLLMEHSQNTVCFLRHSMGQFDKILYHCIMRVTSFLLSVSVCAFATPSPTSPSNPVPYFRLQRPISRSQILHRSMFSVSNRTLASLSRKRFIESY